MNSAPSWIYQVWFPPAAQEKELREPNAGEAAHASGWEAAAENLGKKTQQADTI